jgi:outer membrane protein TolC
MFSRYGRIRQQRIMHPVRVWLCLVVVCFTANASFAQISFTSAIDLALQNSPRIKIAQDNLNRALATLAETKDAFIPSVTVGSGAGVSTGISLTVPTIFTISAQSLAFNYSQRDFIRAAKIGLESSRMALTDANEQVEEDTAIAYISLDSALRRQTAIAEEYGFALKLVSIVQDRMNEGMEADLELKKSRRTTVQIRLQKLQLEDEIASLRQHLGQLTGLPSDQVVTLPESIPSIPLLASSGPSYPDTPAVLSAEANARAKQQWAFGYSRYTLKPQIAFEAQYGRISPINNVSQYYNLHGNYNTASIGVQIQLPFLDAGHNAKAREALADAQHAAHEVSYLRDQQSENRLKLQHSIAELAAKAELAELAQGIAQDQLDAILLKSAVPPMTPKDEENARIQERQAFIDVLDARLRLCESRISFLRETGELEGWLRRIMLRPEKMVLSKR